MVAQKLSFDFVSILTLSVKWYLFFVSLSSGTFFSISSQMFKKYGNIVKIYYKLSCEMKIPKYNFFQKSLLNLLWQMIFFLTGWLPLHNLTPTAIN